ncbi:MAG: hypothetical protein CMJ67_05790 [Planctomycetaceae bacterium]|nr:hypothetical protein [Planctomycetaceae bacterium]
MSIRPARLLRDCFPKTLWDLLRGPERREPTRREPKPVPEPSRSRSTGMKAKYDELVLEMKRVHGIRVVRWRSSTSGCAWQVFYKDGTVARLIESPYPRGPMSCAVFLHEVGHHAIGFATYRPRCLEEYHAWRWSFQSMIDMDFNVTEAVRRRRDEALHHAIRKASRRGLKRLPVELLPFLDPPPRDQPPLPAILDLPTLETESRDGSKVVSDPR